MSDTRSVIAESIASMRQDTPEDGGPEPIESTDAGSDETPEPVEADDLPDEPDPAEDPAETAEGDPAPVVEEKPPVEDKKDDDFDKEAEFTTDARGRKKINLIPQPRVKVMVEKKVAAAVAARDAEHTEKVKGFEAEITHWHGINEIVKTDPERFMQILATANPAFAAYTKGGAQTPAAQPQVQSASDEPMPAPDAFLPDGVTPAYSPEGFAEQQKWQARQVKQQVMNEVRERYKWIDEAKEARDRQEAEIPRVQAKMQYAMEHWEGFRENFDAILDELRKDTAEAERTRTPQKLSIEDAYRIVITGKHKAAAEGWKTEAEKLKADRNKMREEIIAELKGRPATTATLPNTSVPKPAEGAADDPSKTTRDVVRETVARLKARR